MLCGKKSVGISSNGKEGADRLFRSSQDEVAFAGPLEGKEWVRRGGG